MTSVHVLVNPTARKGKGRKAARRVQRLLEGKGLAVTALEPPSADAVASTLTAAIETGMERLIIVGGDGIIHRALPALANTTLPVGIVPSGTGNDFARALGIPTNTAKAVARALMDGVGVDLLNDGDSWAASVVTGGWSGDVNERAEKLAFPKGQQRYTVATLLELGQMRPVGLRLDVDGVVHELDVTLLAVGNTSYFGGGMRVCPNASPADGRLEVALLEPVSAVRLLPIIPKIFAGKHVDHPKVKVFQGSSVKIELEAALWADGERFGSGDAELTVVPNAIHIAGADF